MNDFKNDLPEEKKAGTIANIWHKVSVVSRGAVDKVQKGAKAISVKNKNEAYLKRIEKYHPIYREEYESEEFYLPNMIIIEDDSRRREADVLEKAVGWITTDKSVEIFHLFEDSIEGQQFRFLPNKQCNALYYIDNFDNKCFVQVDSVFSRARDEKIAELKHIAHSLGAKSCSVEILERSFDKKVSTKKVQLKKEGISTEATSEVGRLNSGKVVSVFEGNSNPKKPELKWFANDENIKRLIESRCDGGNSVKSEMIELRGAMSAAMSQKTACSIDLVLSKTTGKASMEKQAFVENESILIFNVEF